ncbi:MULTISPECIES: ribonuclease Z [Staphylococcus]|uniref:Ribonuclease Z n=1 Tax=Staphylococcus cohnii TaxID=29382 RepID=A0A2T4LTJ3_9STAP|nr:MULTISPECIES: ribonuclease Z [Staphylococcus]MBA1354278.1 ribonuclease Z [Staphylococcus cohnii]MBA1391466.1 ribonuclease Z [Staphylococcus cohnii]MBB2507933.1 Ribonuclease Z [Staphylococcus cohnii subsp. barensis]MBZ8172989.1 ribonuclease Z [Staphylococcus cohnii]MCE5033884.1 ribonuclease Z [Staphylococcus cohnii]
MEITFFGTSAGLPTKERNTQAIALNLEPYSNSIWLFDVGEGTQHQILHHSIKLGKVDHIFITHMHGDHIFGLPGLLTSRSFQGGEDKPLTIIGPKGIKSYIETTLTLSESKLNYPITYIEIEEQLSYHHNGFNVEAHMLNHGIPSFGYRVEAPYKSGKINVEALRNIGLEPGPKYQDVKNNETFEYKGEIYNSKDFKDEAIKGPVVAIFGDTMPCKNEMIIARDANIMVHESTYIEGDKSLANSYHHSHIDDVFELMREANVDYSLITHISNRYTKEEVCDISKSLKALSNTPPFSFVSDFDSWQF